MKKFWEWMRNKKYVYIDNYNHKFLENCIDKCSNQFTKQMLIGYMFEYIFEQNKLIIDIPKEYFIFGHKNIYTLYKQLKQMIKEDIKAEKI